MNKNGLNFGTLKGVFIPSILTILGVILFLRMGWVVGQAGLTTAIAIILISSLITFLTGLSISATATNTDVGPGGSYFLISRCFGVEPGAAVGIPLYLAQALGISFYSVGFAESLGLFFPSIPVNFVAMATLIILTGVTLVSSDLALKTQTFILVSILLAIGSFWLGSPLEKVTIGPQPPFDQVGFWKIFAVFFPAVTGIEAGISMSGDLKDPKKSLPIGTMLAVIVGALIYIFSAYMLFTLVPRSPLINNPLILTEIALVPILIFVGLWGATLSSTMGALLGAPRTLQALAKDGIVPKRLGQGAPETNEPRLATVVSFLVACGGILIGDLNTIASVLSMFFLTSYGALNLVAGLEGLIDNPSWRPSFKVSWIVSMAGAFLCFGAMFMIDSGSSFVAIGAIGAIYYVIKKRRIHSNYSDIRSSLVLHFARTFIYKLSLLKKDARNWRPNFLVFSGSSQSRMHLIQLADSISHKRGFLTAATILNSDHYGPEKLAVFERTSQDFLLRNNIEALTKTISNPNLHEAILNFVDYYGMGEIQPNTIILGDASNPDDIQTQAKTVKAIFEKGKNVLVIKDTLTSAEDIARGGRSIDLWWGRQGNNRNLILALAYMLSTSKKWKRSKITIKGSAPNENGKASFQKNLQNFLSESRIKANIEVFVSDEMEGSYFAGKKSADADLVFIGLNKPKPKNSDNDDSTKDFIDHYESMMHLAEDLKTTVFVLEAEKISLNDIFR